MRYLILCALLLMPSVSMGAVRYIDDTGSNSNTGQSIGSPWLTWSHAFANTACGDTLVVLDGTYTPAVNGSPVLTKVCTPSTVYTVVANNERQAKVNGNGNTFSFRVVNSAYVTIDGLYISSTDNSAAGVSTLSIRLSNNVTIRRNVIHRNNRYFNTHLIEVNTSHFGLYEENELYEFHRHGVLVYFSNSNVLRRNYCHARSRAGLPDGFQGTSGDNGTGDNCIVIYPGSNNIVENNIADGTMAKGFAVEAQTTSTGNRFYGNIANGPDKGLTLDARGNVVNEMPNDTIIQDFVSINPPVGGFGPATGREGVYSRSARDIVCRNCMILGTPSRGIVADRASAASAGDGNYSITLEHTLVTDATSFGYQISADVATWSGTNVNAFSNATDYSPSSSSNWISKFTTDPQLGSCLVWRPDGSSAKTNNWGADLLYRYQDGVLTAIPLWDPTNGKFPQGAIVAGVNDTPTTSLQNVHARLNVNTGGCSFPSGYGGGGGGGATNPATHHTASGTGAISVTVTVPVGLDVLIATIALRDGGINVGQVTGITSSCGSQTFTFGIRAKSHRNQPSLHDVEGWSLQNPNSGVCTINATTTGAVGSWVLDVFEHDNSSGVSGWAANDSNGVLSATPTVTVATNAGETVYSATSGSSGSSISAGANQTLLIDELIPPMRLAVSSQSGNDGGVMSYVQGGSSLWATVAVSLLPTSPNPPSTSTFRVSKYRIYSLHGSASNPEISIMALDDQDTPASISTDGSFRMRVEVIVETSSSSPTGISTFCRKNAGGYAQVTNVFGTNVFRYYGPGDGAQGTIPGTLTPTTQRFTGTFAAGMTVRDEALSVVLPSMAANTRTEVDVAITVGNGIAVGDTVECEIRRDNGAALGVHTVRPKVQTVAGRSSKGF